MALKVRRWDLAFSDKQGADFVSGALVGIDEAGRIYILHIKRLKGKWPQTKPVIIQTALDDGPDVGVAIEANGTQLGYYDDIRQDRRMAGRLVVPDKPEGSKEMRASIWGSRLEDGIIYVVRGEWNQALWDEMDAFPNGEHDDQVDAISGAVGLMAWQGPTDQMVVYDEPVSISAF
jgi:predicted phage terminase large subunit-like protein